MGGGGGCVSLGPSFSRGKGGTEKVSDRVPIRTLTFVSQCSFSVSSKNKLQLHLKLLDFRIIYFKSLLGGGYILRV